MGDLMLFRF